MCHNERPKIGEYFITELFENSTISKGYALFKCNTINKSFVNNQEQSNIIHIDNCYRVLRSTDVSLGNNCRYLFMKDAENIINEYNQMSDDSKTKNMNYLSESNQQFLNFIYSRLKNIYNENDNLDYMIKLKNLSIGNY